MTKEDIAEVRAENPNSVFPKITSNTRVGAIFPKSFNTILTLTNLDILLFYQYMNNKHHYNFKLHELWLTQLKQVSQNEQSVAEDQIASTLKTIKFANPSNSLSYGELINTQSSIFSTSSRPRIRHAETQEVVEEEAPPMRRQLPANANINQSTSTASFSCTIL